MNKPGEVTTLYLIRHGETEGAEKRRYKGTIDVPLSENGAAQMEEVAVGLIRIMNRESVRACLKAVYTTDLGRAVKSAEIIGRPHSLEPIVVPSLRERDFGVWEGMSFDEISEKYPDEFCKWAKNPLKFSPVKGESTLEVKERVISSIELILENHYGEYIAIVAHGGVNRVILCHFLGIPLEHIFRIEQDYGALNIVELRDEYPVVKLINGFINW